MIKTIAYHRIHSCVAGASTQDVVLKREIVLPCFPTIGMELHSGGIEWDMVVANVCFDVEEQVCRVYSEGDKEFYHEHEQWTREGRAGEYYPIGRRKALDRALETTQLGLWKWCHPGDYREATGAAS